MFVRTEIKSCLFLKQVCLPNCVIFHHCGKHIQSAIESCSWSLTCILWGIDTGIHITFQVLFWNTNVKVLVNFHVYCNVPLHVLLCCTDVKVHGNFHVLLCCTYVKVHGNFHVLLCCTVVKVTWKFPCTFMLHICKGTCGNFHVLLCFTDVKVHGNFHVLYAAQM